jgi:hypothetical protein
MARHRRQRQVLPHASRPTLDSPIEFKVALDLPGEHEPASTSLHRRRQIALPAQLPDPIQADVQPVGNLVYRESFIHDYRVSGSDLGHSLLGLDLGDSLLLA